MKLWLCPTCGRAYMCNCEWPVYSLMGGARVTYLDHVSEIRAICDKLPKDIDVKQLRTACYGDPASQRDRKILHDECLKVAAALKKFKSLEGSDLEAAAKRILGEGQL